MPVNVTFNLNLAQNTSRILLGYQILILIYNYLALNCHLNVWQDLDVQLNQRIFCYYYIL